MSVVRGGGGGGGEKQVDDAGDAQGPAGGCMRKRRMYGESCESICEAKRRRSGDESWSVE